MDAPSPNNNNDKKMSACGTSSSALTKQGPKKNPIIPPMSSLLNSRNKPTSCKPSMLVKKSFVPSSSKSSMKKPTTFLTMRPTKNLLGASNNNSKSNSLLKKRPTIGAPNNSNKKIVIRPTTLSSMSATTSSILGGGGSSNISGGRSSVAASMPTTKTLTIDGPVSKKSKEKKSFQKNSLKQSLKSNGDVHGCSTDKYKKAQSSRKNALIEAGKFHSHKTKTKSHLLFEALERAEKDLKDSLHNNCGPEIDGDWELRQSSRFYVNSLVFPDLADELDFTCKRLREFLGSYGIEGTSSYGTKNNCPFTGKAGSSSIKWSETAEQKKKKGSRTNLYKNGTKLWFTIHRPSIGPHAA